MPVRHERGTISNLCQSSSDVESHFVATETCCGNAMCA